MSQHTQGKLHIQRYSAAVIQDERERTIAELPDTGRMPLYERKANAERLGACWNEFEGMDTEAIPGSVVRLVEALRAMYKHFGDDDITENGIWNSECVKAMKKTRAALAPFERKEAGE